MINLRAATKNDIKGLQALNEEVFIDNQQYDHDLKMDWSKGKLGEEYFTWLLKQPETCCYIAEDNKKPVGYIAAGPKKINYRKSKYFEIHNMGVNPDHRSKGIGSLLIRECLKWAKSKHYEKVWVNAYFYNMKAISFYKKLGFNEIDIGLETNILK